MQVMIPAASPANDVTSLRRRLDSLNGKVIGVIDNTKPNFHYIADDISEFLVSKYGVAKVIIRRKTAAGIPAPDEMMKELTSHCDAIITGLGD